MWPTPCIRVRPKESYLSRMTPERATKYARLFPVARISWPSHLVRVHGSRQDLQRPIQPNCKFPKDTVITCPGFTQTSCPDRCADGEFKTDCKRTEDSLKCGPSFAAKCDLVPNSLYKSTKDGEPVFDKAFGDLACTKGTPDDSCTDPCNCNSAHNVGPFLFSCGKSL